MKSSPKSRSIRFYLAYIFVFTLFHVIPDAIAQVNIPSDDPSIYEDVSIKGIIINEYTKERLPFVNMIIENTLTGTASDEEGVFNLVFPLYYSENDLFVSAIGFSAKRFSLHELLKTKDIIIELKPTNYEIVGIKIEAESKILYGLLRKAINKTPENYIRSPYKYNFTYKNNFVAGAIARTTESEGVILDKTGYQQQSMTDLFNSRSYVFTKTTRNFKVIPYNSGLTNMDDLMDYDIVRCHNSILSPDNLYQYQLELLSSESYDGDTLMQIGFKNLTPDLLTTHDAYIKYYEGVIYLLKNKNVVIKCIINGSSTKKSIHGKSFYVKGTDDLFGQDMRYTATVNYHTNGKEYHLNSINLMEDFVTANKLKGKSVTQLIISDHELLQVEPILENRDFYNNPGIY